MTNIDLSIRQRLAIGFGAILVLLVGLFGALYLQSQLISEQQHRDALITSRAEAAANMHAAYLGQAVSAHSYALTRDETHLQNYQRSQQQSRVSAERLRILPKDPDGEPIYVEMAALAERYHEASDRLVSLAQQGADEATLQAAEMEMTDLRMQLTGRTESYFALQVAKRQAAAAEIDQAQAEGTRNLLVLGTLMVFVGAVTAHFTTRAVRNPAQHLVSVARALMAGDYGPVLALRPEGKAGPRPRDELRELAQSFGHAASALKSRELRLAARNRVSAALAASIEVERLGRETLTEIAAYTGCEFGAVYLLSQETSDLHRVASYALDQAAEVIAVGDGIPGRAAAEGHTVVVRDIPTEAPWRVRFGFGELPPSCILATPVVAQEGLVGILLLGSLHDVSEDAVSFVEHTAEQLGVSLQNAIAHREIAGLVVELQLKNEELQAQSEEIQTQNEELQAQNEEIQTQNEALLEADRLKDEFLALASHELRSPITSIKGYAQLLLSRTGKQTDLNGQADILRTIDRQSTALANRVNRMLDASRAKMGRLQMHRQATDLAALVQQQVEQASVRSHQHRILVDCPDVQIVGEWDRAYVEQVVANLVDNALRYSPQGGEVKVKLQAADGEAHLTVADSGIGIPAQDLPRIFEPYFRHESAKRVTGDGMGIGLYITREVVEAHGGRIWAESAPGTGSTFHVVLPLDSSTSSAEARRDMVSDDARIV